MNNKFNNQNPMHTQGKEHKPFEPGKKEGGLPGHQKQPGQGGTGREVDPRKEKEGQRKFRE